MRALRHLLWTCPFLACATPPVEQAVVSDEVDTTGQHLTQLASGLYRQGEADSAVVLMQAVLESPPEVAGGKAKAAAHSFLGVHAQRIGRFDESIAQHEQAMAICEVIGDRDCVGRAHTNLCNTYRYKGAHESALQHAFAAMRIKIEQGDSAGLARAHHNLAMIHQEQGDLPDADRELGIALGIKERLGDSLGVQNTLSVMSLVAVDRNEHERAIALLERALAIAESGPAHAGKVDLYTNLGLALEGAARRAEAMAWFRRAMDELQDHPNDAHRSIITGNIGRMLMEDGRLAEAAPWLEESLDLAREVGALVDEKIGLTALLALRKAQGRHREALELSEALMAVNDSLLNERNVESMNELRVRFETERHEAEKRLLQQENELATVRLARQRSTIAGLIGGLLLVAVVVTLLVRAWRRRTAQRILALEHQALRAQMDPHFLFNALNTIPGLYHAQGAARATDYVGHLGQLLRMILDSSAKRAVSVREEVELLTHFLQVMALRHADRFTYSIDVDPAIDTEGSGLPPMLLQPLVENAVLHGVLKRDGAGEVQVSFRQDAGRLHCVVRDNGPGLQGTLDPLGKGKPSGLRITDERIRLAGGRRSAGLVLRTLHDAAGDAIGAEASFQIEATELWDR